MLKVTITKSLSSLARQNIRLLSVLGIETSCDDTGCAIVTHDGVILGQSLNSQALIHLRNGGIIPPVARDLHTEHMERVVDEAVSQTGRAISEFDAIAATVKPGLSLSLLVGARYGQKLALKHNRPFIPIHHMEAHALTVRMVEKVEFPFLVLLVSGGHCQLAVVLDVDKFLTLGNSLDDAPGEAFDKVARRMKLTNLPEFRAMCGGPAIEKAAETGDPNAFEFGPVLTKFRDCNFSFSGIKNIARKHIIKQEQDFDVGADGVIPGVRDLCASFQLSVTRHLCQRVQRAMDFIKHRSLIPPSKCHLVVAGGVACNGYLRKALAVVCADKDYRLSVPPKDLCTDNGLMIAWNGIERLKLNKGIIPPEDAHLIDIEPRCSLGSDISNEVTEADIKCKWVKLPL